MTDCVGDGLVKVADIGADHRCVDDCGETIVIVRTPSLLSVPDRFIEKGELYGERLSGEARRKGPP